MNCGRMATKKSSAFGFDICTTRPRRKRVLWRESAAPADPRQQDLPIAIDGTDDAVLDGAPDVDREIVARTDHVVGTDGHVVDRRERRHVLGEHRVAVLAQRGAEGADEPSRRHRGERRLRRRGLLCLLGRLAADSRWTLVELTPERRDLEDIFRRLAHESVPKEVGAP